MSSHRKNPASASPEAGLLAAMLDALPASIALIDANGRIAATNTAWREGRDPSLAGDTGSSYLDACEYAANAGAVEWRAVAAGLRGVLAGEQTSFVHEHALAAGRWCRSTITPLVHPAGAGAVVMHLDISEQKKAEEQFRAQAALIDQAQDAIFVQDLDDTITFWNKGAEQVFGWSAAQAVGRKAGELLAREATKYAVTRKLVLERGEWAGELRKQTRDGRELIVESRLTLVRAADGRPHSILCLDVDLTERKSIESQVQRVHRLESIGTLANGIAHDLNNVLAPILMSIDLLADELVVGAQRQHILDGLRRSAQRGGAMVRQVLSFARGLEGRRLALQPQLLVDELAGSIQETFPKTIRLKLGQTPPLGTISGDPTQLHQALLNLCVNARDAMPRGGTLTLAAEDATIDESEATMNPEARPGAYVVISVTDTGTGIRPEIKDKIFDPFFTTKEVGKGTGLGLSTVLAIVRGHRGFIQLVTELAKGSTFRIYLPAETAKAEESLPAAAAEVPPGGGELILVVDDEEVILDISRKTLERRGYRVLTANEGAAAVAIYEKHHDEIAAVLTDMRMPVMDGISTLRALRQINPDVKVIAASGLASNANPAKASDAGIRHFLYKPYRSETLLKTVREAIDGTTPPSPAAN
ncbi:MAG TPA: PAS domain S-box protein [Opitutaceae bacterium]|nr:PAS domain S-box protein [Opitutaceae bacterium]